MKKNKTIPIIMIFFAFLLSSSYSAEPTASASSVEEGKDELSAASVIDGNKQTRWSSNWEDNQWLEIDLGEEKDIYALRIIWENAFALEYDVFIFTDPSRKKQVYSTDSGQAGTTDITFERTKGRYIRIETGKRATEYGNSIFEVMAAFKPGEKPRPIAAGGSSTGTWKLIWQDDFNSLSGWTAQSSSRTGQMHDKTAYSPSQASVKGGKLLLTARSDSKGTITSGRVSSQGKTEGKYGKFEARIRVPEGKGFWSVFRLLPGDIETYGPWPESGEISVMECLGADTGKAYGNIYYGLPLSMQGGRYNLESGEKFSDDFHIFAMEWLPGKIQWSVDGEVYASQEQWYTTGGGQAFFPAPFDKDFYLELDLSSGGIWAGEPDASTSYPAVMQVDWVKVYTLEEGYPEVAQNYFGPDIKLDPKRRPDKKGNWIYNGKFKSGTDFWETWNGPGSACTLNADKKKLLITLDQPGRSPDSVILYQQPINLTKDGLYTLTFKASSEKPREMRVSVERSKKPFISYSGIKRIKLGSVPQTHTFLFKMKNNSDNEARVAFYVGREKPSITLDNIFFEAGGDPTQLAVDLGNEIKIEAENYNLMQGMDTEPCSEGTLNMGWIDPGDWLEYNINASRAGTYKLEMRVSGNGDGGKMSIISEGQNIGSVSIPNTGGWQNWDMAETSINLKEGMNRIRLMVDQGGFNFNWWSLTAQ